MGKTNDTLVLATVNNALPRPIDAGALARALWGANVDESHLPHLNALFTEVPMDAIETFAAAHGITHTDLAAAYQRTVAYSHESSPDVEDWFRYLQSAPP